MRAVLEIAGVHNVLAKSHGSSNPHNVVKATIDALYVFHKGMGAVLLVVVLARVAWRLFHRPPPFPDTMHPLEQKIAGRTHAGRAVRMALDDKDSLRHIAPPLWDTMGPHRGGGKMHGLHRGRTRRDNAGMSLDSLRILASSADLGAAIARLASEIGALTIASSPRGSSSSCW